MTNAFSSGPPISMVHISVWFEHCVKMGDTPELCRTWEPWGPNPTRAQSFDGTSQAWRVLRETKASPSTALSV